MNDNEITEKLKMYLEILPNPDEKVFGSGTKRYSLSEIYENIKNRTPEGKKFIEMSKPIIEEIEEGWKKLLQD